jgi:FixJ family two-component response regulator
MTSPLIYVVEDDASVMKGLARLLRAWSYDVRLCGSAQEFLDGPGAGEADCLVLDVHMPGLSGLDLQQELRHRGTEIPVVFVTGHGDAAAQVGALNQGAVAFLKKPFTDQELLAAVARAVSTRGAASI